MRKQQQQGMAVVLLVAVLVMMMLVPEGARAATATACNAGQLTVCAAAIMGGTKPSAACCSNLRAQKGCFCQYAKNPAYGPYITSPNARRAVASCGISLPRC